MSIIWTEREKHLYTGQSKHSNIIWNVHGKILTTFLFQRLAAFDEKRKKKKHHTEIFEFFLHILMNLNSFAREFFQIIRLQNESIFLKTYCISKFIDISTIMQYISTCMRIGLLCWGFKGVQQEIPMEEASTVQIGSVAFPPGQYTSPQLHPCHRLFDLDGKQDSSSSSL